MKPVTVRGNTYTSITAAWREVSPPGLSLVTVRWRLNNGWTETDALTLGTVPAESRRMFKVRVRDRIN